MMIQQEEIQKKIKEINADTTLSSNEKNIKIQKIMMCNYNKTILELNENCNHYVKKCSQLYFDCCNKWYACVRCHNEKKTCSFSKILILKIICSECNSEQIPSKNCVICNIEFSKNYCDKCYIWTEVDIIHCYDCGLCRVGKNDELFHCNTCNGCFYIKNKLNHKCIKFNYKDEFCVLCKESLFSSQNETIILPCDHLIHGNCRNKLIEQNQYKCPYCKKSLCNMNNLWNTIKIKIKLTPIPKDMFPLTVGNIVNTKFGKFKLIKKIIQYDNIFWSGEFINWILKTKNNASGILLESCIEKDLSINIYCNDCCSLSNTNFHFYGLECKKCGSFNTQE